MLKIFRAPFFQQSAIYLTTNILNALLPFILLPIFSRFLSTEEYGKIAIFQLIISGLNAFVGLNTIGAASRKFFDNPPKSELQHYNNSSFVLLFYSLIITLILAYIFRGELIYFFNIPFSWIITAIICSALNYILLFKLSQLQIRRKAVQYGILQLSNSFFNFALTLILIIYVSPNAESRIVAMIVTLFIFSAYCFTSLLRTKTINYKKEKHIFIKDNLLFGLPLVPHIFGLFLLSSIDRFIINKYYDLSTAGIYMMGFQVSLCIIIFFDALNKALTPYLFKKLTKATFQDKKTIVKYSYILFLFCLVIGAVSYLISPLIIKIIGGEKYSQASAFVGILCIGQSFQGMYLVVTNYIFFAKKTYILSLITILSGILNIILIYSFITIYSLLGVSIAFCISMFIRFLCTWILSNYAFPMPWFLNKKEYNVKS
ncbi:TPA: oligosaccharide flippase family protein [Morganella morganii]|nr:oligosaccharide flippase family protein [Morganella morganii]